MSFLRPVFSYVRTNIYLKKNIYKNIYKFTKKCHIQTIPSSERRQPGPRNVFSTLWNPQLWHKKLGQRKPIFWHTLDSECNIFVLLWWNFYHQRLHARFHNISKKAKKHCNNEDFFGKKFSVIFLLVITKEKFKSNEEVINLCLCLSQVLYS